MKQKAGLIYSDEKVHMEAEVEKFRIKDQMKASNVVIIESMNDLETKLKTLFKVSGLNL